MTAGVGDRRGDDPAQFCGQRRERNRQFPATSAEPPHPSSDRGVRNVDTISGRPDAVSITDHRIEGAPDGLDDIQPLHQYKGWEQGMGGTTGATPQPRHPDRRALADRSDLAPIPGPESHGCRTVRTHRPREVDQVTGGHVLVDGQGTRPYDGHRWKHRLGPPPPQCQLVRRGSLAFRDRSSSSLEVARRPIACPKSVAGTRPYVTRQSCRQHQGLDKAWLHVGHGPPAQVGSGGNRP